eukprot:gene19374-biopygen22035
MARAVSIVGLWVARAWHRRGARMPCFPRYPQIAHFGNALITTTHIQITMKSQYHIVIVACSLQAPYKLAAPASLATLAVHAVHAALVALAARATLVTLAARAALAEINGAPANCTSLDICFTTAVFTLRLAQSCLHAQNGASRTDPPWVGDDLRVRPWWDGCWRCGSCPSRTIRPAAASTS